MFGYRLRAPVLAFIALLGMGSSHAATHGGASIEQINAPIHTGAQLDEYMHAMGSSSPLSALSAPALERFVASLRFNESGLVSFRYSDIESELSARQAYRLLALFGAQRTLGLMSNIALETPGDVNVMRSVLEAPAADHPGHECAGRATCSASPQRICMGGC